MKTEVTDNKPVEKTGEEMIKDYGRIEAVIELYDSGQLPEEHAINRIKSIMQIKSPSYFLPVVSGVFEVCDKFGFVTVRVDSHASIIREYGDRKKHFNLCLDSCVYAVTAKAAGLYVGDLFLTYVEAVKIGKEFYNVTIDYKEQTFVATPKKEAV